MSVATITFRGAERRVDYELTRGCADDGFAAVIEWSFVDATPEEIAALAVTDAEDESISAFLHDHYFETFEFGDD